MYIITSQFLSCCTFYQISTVNSSTNAPITQKSNSCMLCVPMFLLHGILLLLALLFEPLLLCMLLFSFFRQQFLCSCREIFADIHATSTLGIEKLFLICGDNHQPELLVSIFHHHARTWRGEYVCPAACPFSQASLLPMVKLGSYCRRFSHKPLVGL